MESSRLNPSLVKGQNYGPPDLSEYRSQRLQYRVEFLAFEIKACFDAPVNSILESTWGGAREESKLPFASASPQI